jgi:hypothetical protein
MPKEMQNHPAYFAGSFLSEHFFASLPIFLNIIAIKSLLSPTVFRGWP